LKIRLKGREKALSIRPFFTALPVLPLKKHIGRDVETIFIPYV